MKVTKKAATNLIALIYGKGMTLMDALEHEGIPTDSICEDDLREAVATLYKVATKKETTQQSKARYIAEGVAANIGVGNTFVSDVVTHAAETANIKPTSVISAGKRCGLWKRIPSMGKALYEVIATA